MECANLGFAHFFATIHSVHAAVQFGQIFGVIRLTQIQQQGSEFIALLLGEFKYLLFYLREAHIRNIDKWERLATILKSGRHLRGWVQPRIVAAHLGYTES